MSDQPKISIEQSIRRQCKIYIDAIIDGISGELIRFHAHAELCRRLVRESDTDALITILHNLDQVIGFTVESVGTQVAEATRQGWANALFDHVWDLYSCSEYWQKGGGAE